MYKKLKELRIKEGYTIKDMAGVIKKSEPHDYKKENGDVKLSVNEALDIAIFLKTKVEKIFNEKLSDTE